MEKNKNYKTIARIYFICSLCFYITSILNIINKGDMGIVYLCLGSTFLCLGSLYINKSREEEKSDSKEEAESIEEKAEDKE